MDFDPYADWLEISGNRRPPTHYDMLGLSDFESSEEVIRKAAIDRMAHVREHCFGSQSQSAIASRVLRELADSLACLTNRELKNKYDRSLGAVPIDSGRTTALHRLTTSINTSTQRWKRHVGANVRWLLGSLLVCTCCAAGVLLADLLLRFNPSDVVGPIETNTGRRQIRGNPSHSSVKSKDVTNRGEGHHTPYGDELTTTHEHGNPSDKRRATVPLISKTRLNLPNSAIAATRFACDTSDLPSAGWIIDGDELAQSSLKPGVSMLFGDARWTDYDFSFDTKLVDGWGLRTYFRYQDELNNHSYVISAFNNTWEMVDVKHEGHFGDRLAEGPYKLCKGDWYHVEIQVRGEKGKCLLDGHNVLGDFPVTQHTNGQVGWCMENGASFRFRNIIIKDPTGRVLLKGLPDFASPGRPMQDGVPRNAVGSVQGFADAFIVGTVWKGMRTYRHGAYAGKTVTYELHVSECDGVTFRGHVFDNGPNRNRADVQGEIDGRILTWRERPLHMAALLTMRGTLAEDKIMVTFTGTYPGGITNEGDGELRRLADNIHN